MRNRDKIKRTGRKMAPIRDSQIQVGYEVVGNNKPSPWLRWFMMGGDYDGDIQQMGQSSLG